MRLTWDLGASPVDNELGSSLTEPWPSGGSSERGEATTSLNRLGSCIFLRVLLADSDLDESSSSSAAGSA